MRYYRVEGVKALPIINTIASTSHNQTQLCENIGKSSNTKRSWSDHDECMYSNRWRRLF